MTADLYSKLTEIMREVFDHETLVAAPELTAADVDGWDSLAHIRLILAIERAYNIKFSASQINNLKNVGELVGQIQAKL